MKKIFSVLHDAILTNDAVLVQVVADSGSTPRGSGAAMVITETGLLTGTIGGGAVEYKSQGLAAQLLKDQTNFISEFSLKEEDIEDLGMICGGDVKVFFRFIQQGDEEVLKLLKAGLESFEQGKKSWFFLDLKQGGFGLYTETAGFNGQFELAEPEEYLSNKPLVKADIYCQPLNRGGKVVVFGGGHVGQELVPILSKIGFDVQVFDDRPEFLTEAVFPTATQRILGDFDNIYDFVDLKKEDYAIVMTRGHAFDLIVQRQLHQKTLTYLGVIGSRRKMAQVFATLKEEGVSQEELDQVFTPIGLNILADTPAEIAISVAAELIQHRAQLRNKK